VLDIKEVTQKSRIKTEALHLFNPYVLDLYEQGKEIETAITGPWNNSCSVSALVKLLQELHTLMDF